MGDPIKEMRGTDKTGTEDNQSGDRGVASIFKRALEEAKKNASFPVIKRSDYIDNAFTTINWNPILNTYILEFKRVGKTYWVEVGADELGRLPLFEHPTMFTGWRRPTEVVTPYNYYEDFLGALYQSEKALGQAAKVNKAAARATAFVSFYRETPERGGVIVPTHYTRATAPRLFRSLLQLHGEKHITDAQRQAWLEVGEVFREGANKLVLNRIGIEMNKQGEYVPAGIPYLEENEQGEYEIAGGRGLPKLSPKSPSLPSHKGRKASGKIVQGKKGSNVYQWISRRQGSRGAAHWLEGDPAKFMASQRGHHVYEYLDENGKLLYVGVSGGLNKPRSWITRLEEEHINTSWIGDTRSVRVTYETTKGEMLAIEEVLIPTARRDANIQAGRYSSLYPQGDASAEAAFALKRRPQAVFSIETAPVRTSR